MIPGLPGSQVSNDGDLMRMIQDIQRDIRELRAQNVLATAGITTAPGSITITGTENVTGNLNVSGTETVSGNLTVSGSETVTGSIDVKGPATFEGTTTIGGNASITGTLSLPAGIINNDALASPVQAAQVSNSQTYFGTTSTAQDFAVSTIPIPAGFTSALVFAVTSAGAINSTSSPDYLYASTSIQGVDSREVFGYAGPSGGSTAITTAKSTILTGLSGGNITVTSSIRSGAAWAANASNRAYVEAQAIFLR